MKNAVVFVAAIGLLTLMLQPTNFVVGGEENLAYVGASKCKMCHNKKSEGKFFDDWEESVHAKAFELLKGDEQKNPECLKCHTTGHGKPGGFVSLEESPKLTGVQCEMCHGPGEKHIKSKKDNVIPNAGKPTTDAMCIKCHNDSNPNWNPERYTKPDGSKTGFYFEEAVKKVNHSKAKEAAGQ